MSALCGEREKFGALRAEQKWDYINLDEFKSHSCLTPLSYIVLFISLIISLSVYAVDTFTAVNLLAFDRWSGQIQPAIPFNISRWIFAGCIICSFVLLFYRWLRAVRVMRQGGVAQSYLDPLAVRVQSIRMGKNGRGFKRFLVFAELTKGKKGADYVALFTYFSFEAWLRIVFAEGPRQVVNILTLYSVTKLKLIPTGDHAATDGHSTIVQFFVNLQAMFDSDKQQAVVLFGMLFTVVIWVISVVNLAIAVLLYIFFLFHHIPSSDGGLKSYCRRKINSRMEKIVQAKVAKTLKREAALRAKQEGQEGSDGKRQPTLPKIGLDGVEKDPELPVLSRANTQTTLPPYSSEAGSSLDFDFKRPPVPEVPEIPDMSGRPGLPTRTTTLASTVSYASNASLLGNTGPMGYGGRSESPGPGGYGRSDSPGPGGMGYRGRPESPGPGGMGYRGRPESPAPSSMGYRGMPEPTGPGPMGYGGRSESPAPGQPMNFDFDGRPMPPGRSFTGGRPESPATGPPMNYDGRPMPPGRSFTGSSQASRGPYPGPRPPTAQGRQTPGGFQMGPPRTGSPMGFPPGQGPNSYQMEPIPRPGTASSMRQPPPSVGRRTPGPGPGPLPGPGPMPIEGRNTPSFSTNPYVNSRSPPPGSGSVSSGSQPQPSNNGGYVPFNPSMRSNTPQAGASDMPRPPQRSMTQPDMPMGDSNQFNSASRHYPPRSGTAPPQTTSNSGGYDDILNEY